MYSSTSLPVVSFGLDCGHSSSAASKNSADRPQYCASEGILQNEWEQFVGIVVEGTRVDGDSCALGLG